MNSNGLVSDVRGYRVYFDTKGNITCFTKRDNVPIKPYWMTYDFPFEELKKLENKNISKFSVFRSLTTLGEYYIDRKKPKVITGYDSRKRDFQQKKKKMGDAVKLLEHERTKPYRLFFNAQGDILCFSKDENVQINNEWLTYNFDQEDLHQLVDLGADRFFVKQDPLREDKWSIERRPLETDRIVSATDFLYEIKHSNKSDYEMLCSVQGTKFTVMLHPDVKKDYVGVNPVHAMRNGYKIMIFYFTTPGDPHMMFDSCRIPLEELIISDKVEVNLNEDCTRAGLFTIKSFEKYARI